MCFVLHEDRVDSGALEEHMVLDARRRSYAEPSHVQNQPNSILFNSSLCLSYSFSTLLRLRTYVACRFRRALTISFSVSWAAIFYLITTDILGPFNAPFAFSQVGYVPGAVLYIVSEYCVIRFLRTIRDPRPTLTCVCFPVGGVACYTGLILWRLFCLLDSDAYPIKTYSDISERIIGKWFKHMCSALQSLQLIINVRSPLRIWGSD